jgi:hypothetical protein
MSDPFLGVNNVVPVLVVVGVGNLWAQNERVTPRCSPGSTVSAHRLGAVDGGLCGHPGRRRPDRGR